MASYSESDNAVWVELEHSNGFKFKVLLNKYEVERANIDQKFLDEITNKYFKLYQKGIIYGQIDDQNTVQTTGEIAAINVSAEFDEDSLLSGDSDMHDSLSIEENTSQSITEHTRYHWPRPAVLLLLNELGKRKEELLRPHKKRILFGQISKVLIDHGYPVTWEICERKWRGLQTMFKKIVDKENKSGSGAVHWEYFDLVQEIIANDPAYIPVVTGAAGIMTTTTTQPEGVGAQTRQNESRNKRSNSQREFLETTLNEIKSNMSELQTDMKQMNEIQTQRNKIMDRVATALEKLVNN